MVRELYASSKVWCVHEIQYNKLLIYLSGLWEIAQDAQEVSLDKRELCLYKLILL